MSATWVGGGDMVRRAVAAAEAERFE
jgi:hypothetical protein